MKDFCLSEESVLATDEKTLILQQLDILFDTQKNEVYGEDYGSNFFDFLWDLSITDNDISSYTEQIIRKYIALNDWQFEVETNILQGTQNDIILVTIKLFNYDDLIEKTYKIG